LNEWTEVWIDHHGTPVVVRQIVGILARRIVCRAKVGDLVERGERYGVMKFGSRIDMFVPPAARVVVKVGDRVVGGVTPVAKLEIPK
jgi:phosphatidylserine decarboxylase